MEKFEKMQQIQHNLGLTEADLKKLQIDKTCFILILKAKYSLIIKEATLALTHSDDSYPLWFATAKSLPNQNTINEIKFSPWNHFLSLNPNDFLILIFNIPNNDTPVFWNIS